MDAKERRRAQWEEMMRQGIHAAVIEALTEHGVEGVTMDRVAQIAGVAKGTLYTYFANKQELVRYAITTSLEPLLEETTAILTSDRPPLEKLEAATMAAVAYFEPNRALFRVFLYDRTMEKEPDHRSLFQASSETLARVIEEGIADGTFRPVDTLKVGSMIVEAHAALIRLRLASDEPGAAEEDARLLLDVFLRGIAGPGAAS